MSCLKLINCVRTPTVFNCSFLRGSTSQVRLLCSKGKTEDVPIHTGQQWDSDDYRMVRFVNAPKHVNPNFAVDLIAKVPPKPVKDRIVFCDGGDDKTGHPRVYINLDKPGNHTCGYCGLRFVKEDHH